MEAESAIFNDKYRSEAPDRVYILLDILPEKINIGVLNMVYEQIIHTQLKSTIFFNSKAYNLLNMLEILKLKETGLVRTNFFDNLKYINQEYINNKEVRIDNYLNIIVITDLNEINKDEVFKLVKAVENDFKSRGEDAAYTRQIDIATILYDIDIDAENTDSYIEIFEDHDLFKIDSTEPIEIKTAKLKGTFDQIYKSIFDVKYLKATSNLELTFMNAPNMTIMCDVYELGSHNLLAGQTSYKTKLFEQGNPEKGEVFNKRFTCNPDTNERLEPHQVKSYYQLANEKFISSEDADKIFQNQVFIGEEKLIEDNKPFLSVIGFTPLESYNNIASLMNISKALELKPTNESVHESLFYDLKNEMVESGTVMLGIGRALASKDIRNCVVVARKIEGLAIEDNIKLFLLELPFKDEIRLFPKCATNEDYKSSQIEAEYYSELKNIFDNIFVNDKNIRLSPTDFQNLISQYNYKDINTKQYENVLRKKTFVLLEEEPQGIDQLDDTYSLVEQRNEYLHAGYADELNIIHAISNAYYKQYQHLIASKKRPSNPRTSLSVKRAKK